MYNPDGFNTSSLYLRLRPSFSHFCILLLSVFLPLLALSLNELFNPWLQYFLGLALLVSGLEYLNRVVWLKDDRAIVELIMSQGDWQVRYVNGQLCRATILPPVVVTAWFIILRFKVEGGGAQSVVLAKDALHPDVFRRCQVMFRYGAGSIASGNFKSFLAGK